MNGRVYARHARHAYAKVRNTLTGAYAYGNKLATGISRAVDVGKRLYSIAEPMLQQASPDMAKQVNKAVRGGLGSYEEIRGRVLDANEAGQQILGSVRKKVPEIGL